MKRIRFFSAFVFLLSLVLSACGGTAAPAVTEAPIGVEQPPAATEEAPPPVPTPEAALGWSTTASTRTELSFAFPGEWDGASPLTFGEGLFVKHPDQPIGMTFQIALKGSPAELLAAWGKKEIGVVGIATFTPDAVEDSPAVVISRVEVPTRTASNAELKARVAYVQRAKDVLEVMWFAPQDQWEALQPVFEKILASVEIWRVYSHSGLGLQTMYPHDWQAPAPVWAGDGIWFRAQDDSRGMAVFIHNEIADPVQKLAEWQPDRLAGLDMQDCSLAAGDRMDAFSAQWESRLGECSRAGTVYTFEVSFVPNKNRLLEIITYAPKDEWQQAGEVSFRHLLGMLIDLRQ